MKNLRYIHNYILNYKWHLLLGILFVLATNYFKVKIPQIVRDGLNYVFEIVKESKVNGQENIISAELLKFSLMILGLAILMGITLYFTRQTVIVMSRLIEYDLRKDIYSKYQILDADFFKKFRTGDLMSRISEDVGKVRMYLGPCLLYGMNLVALFFIAIYAMLKVSPTLTFIRFFHCLFYLCLFITSVVRSINGVSASKSKLQK